MRSHLCRDLASRVLLFITKAPTHLNLLIHLTLFATLSIASNDQLALSAGSGIRSLEEDRISEYECPNQKEIPKCLIRSAEITLSALLSSH